MKRQALTAKFIVPVNQEHTVTCGDSEERNETDNRRDTDNLVREEDGEDTSDKGQRKIQEHGRSLSDILELTIKKQEYHDYRHQ